MIFNEALYALILVVSAAIFHLLPTKARAWWLAAVGTAFYAYFANAFVGLLLVETLVIYLCARYLPRFSILYAGGLAIAIGLLAYFKYRAMLLGGLMAVLPAASAGGLPDPGRMVVPLAISFFTFEFVHYLVDWRRGKIAPHTVGEFLAFIMFFPTMVAGPIKRFQDFVPKLAAARFAWADVWAGGSRIILGMAKKTVIADSMDHWVLPLQSLVGIETTAPGGLYVALLAYAIKIYADFSGYSDMAIGSARLFGIRVPENFDYPYLQPNIALFWRHWHISLSQWITDYVYIGLGGSRRGFNRTLLNVVLALTASGIWHGAEWHFLVWGLYHGVLLAGHRLWRDRLLPRLPGVAMPAWLTRGLATGLTFACVTLGWALFIMPVAHVGRLLPRLAGY
jgi:alginate O-acetyltransferase complex protein AlgI